MLKGAGAEVAGLERRVTPDLGGLAAFDMRDGDVGGGSLAAPGFGDAPALPGAIQALLLLFERLGWCIHQAEHLIHRLTSGEIVLREPAYPIVRAAVAVPPPIDAFAWILGYAAGQRKPCPLLLGACLELGRLLSRCVTPETPGLPIIGPAHGQSQGRTQAPHT